MWVVQVLQSFGFVKWSSLRAKLAAASRQSVVPLVASLAACSGTDVGYPRVSEWEAVASAGATSSGGSGMPGTDGVAGAASVTSGTSGSSAGAQGSTSRAGAAATAGTGNVEGGSPGGVSGGSGSLATFPWPAAFDAASAPTPADGHHNPGASCMSSVCHGTKVPFVFGGTVYRVDGSTGAGNVEIGIYDGVLTLTAYSAANGNIWLASSAGPLDWTKAIIAIRNGNGERVKPASAPRGSACNGTGCHGSTMRLLAP